MREREAVEFVDGDHMDGASLDGGEEPMQGVALGNTGAGPSVQSKTRIKLSQFRWP